MRPEYRQVTVQTGCARTGMRRKHHLHRKTQVLPCEPKKLKLFGLSVGLAMFFSLRAKKAKAFWSLSRTRNVFLTKMDALHRLRTVRTACLNCYTTIRRKCALDRNIFVFLTVCVKLLTYGILSIRDRIPRFHLAYGTREMKRGHSNGY